jgi:hypothetical protein
MIEDARIEAVLMNHPVTNFGYRIDCGGKSLFLPENRVGSWHV